MMEFNEHLCGKFILEDKMYAAHIVLKVVRNDFILGKTTIEDWIRLLSLEDAYLILRIIEEHNNGKENTYGGSSFLDIEECVTMMFYIQNKEFPSYEKIWEIYTFVYNKILEKVN